MGAAKEVGALCRCLRRLQNEGCGRLVGLLVSTAIFSYVVLVCRQGGGGLFPPDNASSDSLLFPPGAELRVVVQGSRPIALVTTAALRGGGGLEYGELKAAYVFSVSMHNKARYCAAHGWSLVVGGEVPENRGRSARWNKVAWLRRLQASYEWLVWMDLDTLFLRFDTDLTTIFEKRKKNVVDAFFTLDFFEGGDDTNKRSSLLLPSTALRFDGRRVNTGSFALRGKSPWTAAFLEEVWEHNDDGEGNSDQNSINFVLRYRAAATLDSKVSLVPKSLMNAFPDVHYVPTEHYEPAPRGDEGPESIVVHFAGQFGGARASDGQTPGTMLVQFLDLLLERHAKALANIGSPLEKEVQGARRAFERCLSQIRTRYKRQVDEYTVAETFAPQKDEDKCDADKALRHARQFLVALAPENAPTLLCARPTRFSSNNASQTILVSDIVGKAASSVKSLGAKENPRLVAPPLFAPREWARTSTARYAVVVLLHECAAVLRRGVVVAVATQTSRLELSSSSRRKTGDDDVGPLRKDKPKRLLRRKVLIEQETREEEDLASALVVGPLPSRRQLFPTETIGKTNNKGDEIVSASYFWRFLAPLVLSCLDATPDRGARIVILASEDDEYAPFVASDEDWRAIGLSEKPIFLLGAGRKSATEEVAAYADNLYTCHFIERRDSSYSLMKARRDLLKVAAAKLDKVRSALSFHSEEPHEDAVGVVVVCGAPGGFRDCPAVVSAAKSVAGDYVQVRSSIDVSRRDEAAWHGLSRRRFLSRTDVLVFPRVSERFDVAPLLCLTCRSGTALLQLATGPPLPPGYSFTALASQALGFTLVPVSGATDYQAAFATNLLPLIHAARKRKTSTIHSAVVPGHQDDGGSEDLLGSH